MISGGVKLMVHFKGGCLHAPAKRIILIETINTAFKLLFFIEQLLNAASFIYFSAISKGLRTGHAERYTSFLATENIVLNIL